MDDNIFRTASSDFKRSWAYMCDSLKCAKGDLTLGDLVNITPDDFPHWIKYDICKLLCGKYPRTYICPLPADTTLLDNCAYCKKYPLVVQECKMKKSPRFHLVAICDLMDRYESELADVIEMEIGKEGKIVFRVASYDMPCDRRFALFPKKEDATKVPDMDDTYETQVQTLAKLPRQTLKIMCVALVGNNFRGISERLIGNALAQIIMIRVTELVQEQEVQEQEAQEE